jgi:ATP-dependent HslUV protease subunit HslV
MRLKSRSTTILTVRHKDRVAIGGDGQVTLGTSIMKGDAHKIRRVLDGRVITGFAGSSADCFALLERFEAKLKDYPSNIPRAATELAKDWRTDRAMRRLEAMLAVCDRQASLIVSGAGDVIEPTDGVIGIGSGGPFAASAAKALLEFTQMSPEEIVKAAMKIAGETCIYTNTNVKVMTL